MMQRTARFSPARGGYAVLRGGIAALLVAAVAGCTTLEAPLKSNLDSPSAARRSCANWFAQLDATVDRAAARDAGAYRIPGFPYLRVDRFTASFRDRAHDDPKMFEAWIARMRRLDAEARGYEIDNLPAHSFPVAGIDDRAAARVKTETCSAELAGADLADAQGRGLVIERAQVPDSYSNWKRVLGLYALTSIAFSKGIETWHEETLEEFRNAGMQTPPVAGVVRYAAAATPGTADKVTPGYSDLRTDALGIPQFTERERELLFDAYAPAFEIDTTGDYDRFGALAWGAGLAPVVDLTRPVAYKRIAFTRFYGKILAQLVYTIWFPERPRTGAGDILGGKLDGVVIRVTLGADGAPLVYDTMHPCGCYHMFFPTALVKALPAPPGREEWAFVPAVLPALRAAQRVVVRVASRTHYVTGIRADSADTGVAYRLVDDNGLRALPAADQVRRSAFGPGGIVPGTERGERFLFWPMGIDNPGAMRQWGTHATAFIGRRHFDDAYLLEPRFAITGDGHITAVQSQ